jgi:release factor glutamine methyltransferase
MTWLAPGGWLLLEIGHRQGPVVEHLLRDAGLIEVSIEPDLVGRDRYAIGRRPAG